jgi:hypothetical protein
VTTATAGAGSAVVILEISSFGFRKKTTRLDDLRYLDFLHEGEDDEDEEEGDEEADEGIFFKDG